MSPATARARVASAVRRARPVDPAPRPRLTLLAPPASTRFRLPFAALCAAVLVASLLGVLVLNIVLSRGAYAEHVLEIRTIELAESEQRLSERLAVQASPAVLSERARELGMVPNTNPAFLRMSDGTVLGSPAPAEAGKVPPSASIPAASLPAVPDPAAAAAAAAAGPARAPDASAAARAADAQAAAAQAEADATAAAADPPAAGPPGAAPAGAAPAGAAPAAGDAAAGDAAAADPAVEQPVGDGAVGAGGGDAP